MFFQVVEYVGEIVGLRVADKREANYHSRGKMQYEGACYFFRIDKESIIDATRKGGIARFVNHSCSVSIPSHDDNSTILVQFIFIFTVGNGF
jgi:SET domain-containing protein